MNRDNYDILDYKHWNRRLLNLYWICNGMILLTELILMLYLYMVGSLWYPIKYHVIHFILYPSALMLLFTVVCEIAVVCLKNRYRNFQPYVITFTCVAYCTVLLCVHYSIAVLTTAYCIPIIFALIYNKRRVMSATFFFSLIVFVCTFYIMYQRRESLPYYTLTYVEAITAVALIVATYLICMLIVSRFEQISDILAVTERDAYESKMAQEYAESLAETRTRFLANMSHEIRTPMNVVLGIAELVLDGDTLMLKDREHLTKIRDSAVGLLDIINDILDISKIDAGETHLAISPFNLNDLLSECKMIAAYEAKQKGLRFYFYNEAAPLCLLLGDPVRLRQALINILSNAVKFTNKGSVTFLAKMEQLLPSDTDASIYFEVTDTGIGIAPEQIDEIFEPFKQADDSVTRGFGGTGLGLSITKGIIEAMGGKIAVASIPGQCSRFSFTIKFPISDAEDVTDKIEKPTFVGDVLLCEDNDLGRIVAAENLSRLGLRVFFAENGASAVRYVENRKRVNKPFSIIFMDIHMPIMDGIQATQKIVEMGVETPIIALTANVMDDDKKTYLEAGMVDCLSKPFRPHELWTLLTKYINVAATSDSLKSESPPSEDAPPINHYMGLENSANNESLYQSSLQFFVINHQKQLTTLVKALSVKDYILAHRTAHTARNDANIIGAIKLAELATILEESLRRDGSYYRSDMLTAYQDELDRVVAYCKKYGAF